LPFNESGATGRCSQIQLRSSDDLPDGSGLLQGIQKTIFITANKHRCAEAFDYKGFRRFFMLFNLHITATFFCYAIYKEMPDGCDVTVIVTDKGVSAVGSVGHITER